MVQPVDVTVGMRAAPMPGTQDRELTEHANTLRALADILRQIAATKPALEDPDIHDVLTRIGGIGTPHELDHLMDRLLAATGEFIAERTGDTDEMHHLMALTGPRKRLPFAAHLEQTGNDDENDPAAPRTFMKL